MGQWKHARRGRLTRSLACGLKLARCEPASCSAATRPCPPRPLHSRQPSDCTAQQHCRSAALPHRVHKARHEHRLAQLVAAGNDALLQHRHHLQHGRRGPPRAGMFRQLASWQERGARSAQPASRSDAQDLRSRCLRPARPLPGCRLTEPNMQSLSPRACLPRASPTLPLCDQDNNHPHNTSAGKRQPGLASGSKSSPRLPREMMMPSATLAIPSKLRTADLRSICGGWARACVALWAGNKSASGEGLHPAVRPGQPLQSLTRPIHARPAASQATGQPPARALPRSPTFAMSLV